MARMYEMNLVIRLQDRASARMRRISGDMSTLARHAQAQNKLVQLQAQSQAAQVRQGKALSNLRSLEHKDGAKRIANLTAESRLTAQIARQQQSMLSTRKVRGDVTKRRIPPPTYDAFIRKETNLEREQFLKNHGYNKAERAQLWDYLALKNKQHGMEQLIADDIKLQTVALGNEIEAQKALNAEIAQRAALEAKASAAANRYRRGRSVAHGGSLAFMGGAVTVGLSALAASSYSKFDVQAAKAATQVGSTSVKITVALEQARQATQRLEGELLGLAKQYPATAEEMAAASYNIFSSMDLGATATERMTNGLVVLKEANKAAVGGQVDLATATDTLITVFNDFLPKTNNVAQNVGLVHKEMGQLFSIVRFMRGGFTELSAGMNKLAPAARQAHQSLIQVGAAFAVVTQAIPSAAQASTAQARLMDLFGSKAFINGMQKAGESITYTAKNGSTQLIPLYDILQKIVNLDPTLQLGGPKLTQFVKEITQFGSPTGKGGTKGLIQMQRALTVLIIEHRKHKSILHQASQDVTEYDKSVQLLSQTANVKWKIAVNNLKVAWIQFGKSVMPVLLTFLGYFQRGLDWFNKLGSGTKDMLGKIIITLGLAATAAGLFGSAFGGVMMLTATKRLWAIEKALLAIQTAEEGVAASSVGAKAGILGIGKSILRTAGWIGVAIALMESLKDAVNIQQNVKGNIFQKFARYETGRGIITGLAGIIGKSKEVGDIYDSIYKKFPVLFGKTVVKVKKDLKSLTDAEKAAADEIKAGKGPSKLDKIMALNAAAINSEKKLASWVKRLEHEKVVARQQAMKQQKTDVENAAKNLLSKYRELEAANKAAMGALLSGPISGGPILGAFKQINDTLMGLGIKPIKVPLQFIMQDAQKQLENFDLWRGGLDKIKSKLPKGLTKEVQTGFMNSLKAGGIEKLPEILSLADANPSKLKEYIGLWEKMKKAVDASTKADFTEQLKLWQSYGKDVAWKIAQGMVDSGAEAALLDTFTKTITTTFSGQLTKSMNDAVALAIKNWIAANPKPKVTAPATPKQTAWAERTLNAQNRRDAEAEYKANQKAHGWAMNNPNLARARTPADTNPSGASGGSSWTGKIGNTVKKIFGGSLWRANGGLIPGSGNRDTVPAMLTPGEVVLNRRQIANAAQMLGTANHPQAVFNKVQRFGLGGIVRHPLRALDRLADTIDMGTVPGTKKRVEKQMRDNWWDHFIMKYRENAGLPYKEPKRHSLFYPSQHFEGGGVAGAYDAQSLAAYRSVAKKKKHSFMDYVTGGGKVQRFGTWVGGRKGLYGAGKEIAQSFTNEGLKAQAAGIYSSFRHPVERLTSGGDMMYPGGKPGKSKLTARQRIDAENAFLDAKQAGINQKADAVIRGGGTSRPHPKAKAIDIRDVVAPDPGEIPTTDISAARAELNARKARLAAEKSRLGMAGTPAERAELARRYAAIEAQTGLDLSRPLTDADLAGLQERINATTAYKGPANEMPDHILSQASRIRSEKKADAARLTQRNYDRATDITKAKTGFVTNADEAILLARQLAELTEEHRLDVSVFESSGGSAAGRAYLDRSYHVKATALLNKLYKRRASMAPSDKSTGALHRAKTNLDRLEGRLSIEPKIGRMPGGSKPPAPNITDAQVKAAKRLHGGHGEALRAIDRGEFRGWQGRMPSFSSMRGREPFNFAPDIGATSARLKRFGTGKQRKTLYDLANSEEVIEQIGYKGGPGTKDLFNMVSNAPEYKRGMKTKHGRLYRLNIDDLGYGLDNRLAIIQNPETGVMLATPGLIHHGGLIQKAESLGYRFPRNPKSPFDSMLQHVVTGKFAVQNLGELPGTVRWDMPEPSVSLAKAMGVGGPAATVGRMRLLKQLQSIGYRVWGDETGTLNLSGFGGTNHSFGTMRDIFSVRGKTPEWIDMVNEAFSGIDSVHKYPLRSLPGQKKFPFNEGRISEGGDAVGWLEVVHNKGNLTRLNNLNVTNRHPTIMSKFPSYWKEAQSSVATHEIGHFIDSTVFRGTSFGSKSGSHGYPEAMDWLMHDIHGSRTAGYLNLAYAREGKRAGQGQMSLPYELFARAYQQWVARSSGHKGLNKAIDESLSTGSMRYWPDAEFSKIGMRMSDLFDEANLLTGPRKYAKGGWVKGSGNRDNVPAFLTPGEYVVSKPMIRDLTSRKAGAAAPTTHVTHEQNINVDVTNPTGKAILDALKPVLFGLRHQP